MIKRSIIILIGFLGWFVTNAQVDGQTLFEDNCTACHTIGKILVGPNLEGVTERRPEPWIRSFITNSTSMIKNGDKDAVAIFEKFNKTEMTSFQGSFSEEEMTALIDYLKVAEAVTPPQPPKPPFEGETPKVTKPMKPTQMMFIAIVSLVLFVIVMLLLMSVSNVASFLKNNLSEEEFDSSPTNKFVGLFSGDFRLFTGEYIESSTEGHVYDGIQELDNTMPPWLQGIFYLTIIGAFGYLINYHIINPQDTQLKEYQDEMTAATIKYGDMDVVRIPILQVEDKNRLATAKTTFESKCAACHLADGGGSVGPNLTDEYWINGGTLEDVFHTIRNGVPAKGMISWKGQISDEEILDLASFIKNLKGTTPTKAKEPQGEKYND